MGIEILPFGATADGAARLFVLTRPGGLTVRITDLGAALVGLEAPDRRGRTADVVGGFEGAEGYASPDNQHFGAVIGRVANRIAGASFTLDGVVFRLAANLPPHHLHGGAARSFDKVRWRADAGADREAPWVRFSYLSAHGEEGYPGDLEVAATYAVAAPDELRLELRAATDRPTPVSLTHHPYWNLAGHGAGSVLDHELLVRARRYTPVDAELLPTGVVAPVSGTPFDFTHSRRLGERIAQLADSPAGGYDHNFALDPGGGALELAARLSEPLSGRWLEVHTTQPGLQLYTGNGLRGQRGKDGARYGRHGLLCLEPQAFPDALHHPSFPPIVLRPGETYRATILYRLGVDAR